MELSLRELQMLAGVEYSIESSRETLGRIVEYFKAKEYHAEVMGVMAETRELPVELLEEMDVFFVDEDLEEIDIPEEFRAESLGFVKRGGYLTYSGRIVYPVKDVRGNVMGFCGWDIAAMPKYLDSKNHGYKAKLNTFYGMEKLEEYFRSGKPIYVVEGIVDCLYLRSIGLQAIALLGSSITKFVLQILSWVESRLVFIPDNDIIGKTGVEIGATKPAGEHFVHQVKKMLPKATIIQSIVAKDVDDTRKVEEHKYEELFIQELKSVAICPFNFFQTIRVR